MFQGQFGGKVGKRFEKWGLFGKARPGFVGFSRVFDFGGVQVGAGNEFVTKVYPSLDVGAVVEFYVSPRWMGRFDIDETFIHYPELQFSNFTPPLVLQASEIRHNLQVSGIGFGFRRKAWEIVSVRQAGSLSLCREQAYK